MMSSGSSYSQDWRRYGPYKMWVNAFETLSGSPLEPVTEEELRSEMARYFHLEGKPDHDPEETVPIDMAVEAGILTRDSANNTLQLAAVEEVDLEIGGYVRILRGKPDYLQRESTVSSETIGSD